MNKYRAFDPADMKAFEPTEKVGLIATVNPQGLPHLTLITTILAKTPTQLIWGQFTKGLSKYFIRRNPKTAFLIMTLERKLWRGKAMFTHTAQEGEDYILLNEKPMFRYNSYFGIDTIYYMDLVETYGREALPMAKIGSSLLLTKIAKSGAATGQTERILKPWAEGLFNQMAAPKFVAYVGQDGFPEIIPLIQCQAADSRRLVFSTRAYADELAQMPAGAPVAVFCLSLKMENILVRGIYRGPQNHRLIQLGVVDIDWVYNSMPPKHGPIYPAQELKAVTEF